jgi:cell wall-associated NlpC family hydrolase
LLATVLVSSGRAGILLAITLLIGLICSLLTTAEPASASVSMAAARRAEAVHVAASLKGRPYHYGATGPRVFDCSGYTRYVLARVGKHLPRTSRRQYAASRKIARGAARPGDLVFFKSGGRVTHVALYAGGHQVWHAPHSGARVRKERIWTDNWSAGRVLPVA